MTAFVAGDLFIVLPATDRGQQDADRPARTARIRRPASCPDVIVPATFNFPHTGKLLSISFIMFAGWFSDAEVRGPDYPQLALTGLLTFFGSLNAAVPFLLDMFRIPADTFQLFLATGVINSRFGTLVAAVHTVTVALLGTCAITGLLQFRRTRLVRYLAVTTLLTVAVIGGSRARVRGIASAARTRATRCSAGCICFSNPVRPSCIRPSPRPDLSTRVRSWSGSAAAARCASATCPMRCRSPSSTRVGTSSASTSNWHTVWPASLVSAWSSFPSTGRGCASSCRRATAISSSAASR